MESYHGNQNSVKSSLRLINTGANLVTRDQAEQLLHADDMIGQWLTGDVDVYPPDQWCAWVDDWRWEPTIEPDETELEMVRTAIEEEVAILDQEFEESGMDTEEFHRWLDSLEPTIGELEARDMSDCGFGHQA